MTRPLRAAHAAVMTVLALVLGWVVLSFVLGLLLALGRSPSPLEGARHRPFLPAEPGLLDREPRVRGRG